MKTVTVVNEHARIIPVTDPESVEVFRCFFDEQAVLVVIEDDEVLQESA